jgi:hypothetical protein
MTIGGDVPKGFGETASGYAPRLPFPKGSPVLIKLTLDVFLKKHNIKF